MELEDIVVRLFRPLKLAGVHGDHWTVYLGISVDLRCPAWRGDLPLSRSALDSFARGISGGKVARAIYIVAEITHVIFSSSDWTNYI